MALFLKLMNPASGMRILDLGGQPDIWDHVEPALNITCVNLPGVANKNHETHHSITYMEGDACNLHGLRREDFDIVFSNSVIEHVGDENKRLQFANEVLRLSRRYWIQTPSKWFPIEAHCGMPFWWFYPEALRTRLLGRWRRKLPAWTEMVAGTSVVSTTELRSILPGCRIQHERVLGMSKSIVAYSAGDRPGQASPN
jgi:SAM-dependent methyltransferase